MSTAFAVEDDGWFVEGPSVARAFLHALALKLHRLALAARHAATQVLRGLKAIPGVVIDTTLTVVSTVRGRSGFGAAVSLVLTIGQVVAYAAHALAIRVTVVALGTAARARDLITSVPKPRLPECVTTQARALSQNPWVAGVLLALAVLTAAAVALRRLAQGHARATAGSVAISLSEDELERIMKGLYVTLGADGSVHVHGIPLTITDDVRDAVASVAADAAMQRLESLVKRGRPLSSLDLQAVNVAARSAVARQFSSAADQPLAEAS